MQRNVVHNRFWDWPLIENTLQLFLFAENTEIKKLLKVSAIYSGESAVVRALPVAIETLAGMVRDFELLFSTDHRRLGLFLNSLLVVSKNSFLLSLIARFTCERVV